MSYTKIQIPNANIKIIGGKAKGVDYQYKDVLGDFMNANVIRIATFNFNLPLSDDELKKLIESINFRQADVKIVIGVPGITLNEKDWKNRLEETIEQLIGFFKTDQIRINVFNHSKIIGTENRLYLGSQNFSAGSYLNYESGVIIEESDIIRRVYDDIYDNIWEESISLNDAWHSFSSIRYSAFEMTAEEVYRRYKQGY